MISNTRILAEILARKEASLAELNKVNYHPAYQPAIDQFKQLDDESMISLMSEELLPNFTFDEQQVQFQGFEWFYDGGYFPEITGYYGCDCSITEFDNNLSVGSDTWNYRYDFNSGIEPTEFLDSDAGYFDMRIVTQPLYDVICWRGRQYVGDINKNGDYDDLRSVLESIYSLKLYEVLHKAMERLVNDKKIDDENLKKPFFVFANNHTHSPFLIYIIE